jgi:hypothetical protein
VLLNRDDAVIDRYLYQKRTLMEQFQEALKQRVAVQLKEGKDQGGNKEDEEHLDTIVEILRKKSE